MEFPFGESPQRDRRQPKPNPYNPARPIPGSWDDELDTIPLPGAFVASSTSQAVPDATREELRTSKSLYLTDTTADLKAGDRIRRGAETYYVRERPEGDMNPWTGWKPVVEIPLSMTEG